jgi:hypothetical protein
MNRKSKFLIGIVCAIITFGTLMATVGRPHYMKHFDHCHQSEMKHE